MVVIFFSLLTDLCHQVCGIVRSALDAPHKVMLLSETQLLRVSSDAGRAVLAQTTKPYKPHGFDSPVNLELTGWGQVLTPPGAPTASRDLLHRLVDPIGLFSL